jgi:hypothetical protein
LIINSRLQGGFLVENMERNKRQPNYQGQKFMDKYYDYQSWKQRREELFPESREPEKQLKKGGWHFEECPETGRIVVETPQVLRPYSSSDGYGWTELWTCFDCGAQKKV